MPGERSLSRSPTSAGSRPSGGARSAHAASPARGLPTRVDGRYRLGQRGEERVILEHFTRMGECSAPDWPRHPSPHGGYRVIVDGMPTYTVDIEMHGRGNNLRGLTYATVMREINAIPAVIAAPPTPTTKSPTPPPKIFP